VKWVPYFGIIAAIINFAFGVSFNFANLFVGEWVMIGLFTTYTIPLAIAQK
ncbi:hypothetical protein IMZ68_00585, partial [Candidatus Bathyarchaeota archaeon]|nr:hypothetical protein [Candidatus Bathyarchaeota archaeon]